MPAGLCPFFFCNSFRERAGCFTLFMPVFLSMFQCLFEMALWVGLRFVVVTFPDHTRLFLSPIMPQSRPQRMVVFCDSVLGSNDKT